MSLNPKPGKDIKVKHIEFKGTQKEYEALADVMSQALDKLNIDLKPSDLDVPGRITLKREGKITQWQYPKLEKAMSEFVESLRDVGDGTADFGKANITEDPAELLKTSPTLRRMNQTATGKNLGAGDIYGKEDLADDLERLLDVRTKGGVTAPLTKMKPLWVYASDLVLHKGKAPLGMFVKNKEALKRIKAYPPDLGVEKAWRQLAKDGYNQAYFIVLRTEKLYPPEMPIRTKSGQWDEWIKSRPVPGSMKLYKGMPPKNYGELLERFAVYTASRTFGLTDAFLAPVYAGAELENRVGGKQMFDNKVLQTDPIKSKTAKGIEGEYATYLGFVVVGKGIQRTVDLGKEPVESATALPGWD